MRFKFDANQGYQLRVIESVAELFGPVAHRLALDETQLLKNLRAVQNKNRLLLDDELGWIEEEIPGGAVPRSARFANFSVEMEAGTGRPTTSS